MTALRITPLTLDLADAWSVLFAACASGCFCRYWHFAGTTNDWLARVALEPGTNEAEARERLATDSAESGGLVALEGARVLGWLKLVPRGALPKLRRLPVYRALDLGDDAGVRSVGCFLVHPAHRRRGIGRALLREALGQARATGARFVEAYPHRRGEALREDELWMGPLALFQELGFVDIGGNEAYPVLRYALDAPLEG